MQKTHTNKQNKGFKKIHFCTVPLLRGQLDFILTALNNQPDFPFQESKIQTKKIIKKESKVNNVI